LEFLRFFAGEFTNLFESDIVEEDEDEKKEHFT
jgi:hypothetical protein